MRRAKEMYVIEADAVAVTILKRSFQLAGYEPDFSLAETWADAQHNLCKTPLPDLILLEPILPDNSVEDTLDWMNSQGIFDKSHVYILSAILPDILTELCALYPHKGCLFKPAREADIHMLIRNLMQ